MFQGQINSSTFHTIFIQTKEDQKEKLVVGFFFKKLGINVN